MKQTYINDANTCIVYLIFGEVNEVTEVKSSIKTIIEKLTTETKSVFSDKVFNLAADIGIGEILVQDSLNELMEENFIAEPMRGVLKRV